MIIFHRRRQSSTGGDDCLSRMVDEDYLLATAFNWSTSTGDIINKDMVLVVDNHQNVQKKKRKRKPKGLKNDKSDFKGLGEINVNMKKIDLLYLARDASDEFKANLNKITEGMVKEAEFMGVLKDLEGVWSGEKKWRKFVKATIFGDALPKN
ncbi:zinc finger, C2H2-like, DNA-binding domain protein [Tanacetum coccineum]